MAKRTKGPEDLQLEEPPAVNGGESQTLQDRIEEREYKIETADREKIDEIILSNDVQKGGKIRLERRGATDRDYQFVQTIPVEQWKTDETFEYIRKMYGGGDYKAMTFRANGQMYKPFTFAIDYRYKGKLDEADIAKLKDQPHQTDMLTKMMEVFRQPSDGFKSSDLIKLMEMGNSRSEQMMTLVMTMMMKSQETQATITSAMITAIAGRQTQQGIDPVILEMLRAKTERSPISEVLDTMRALKELNEDPPKEEKEETVIEKILKLAPAFIPALQAPQVQAQLAQPQPQAPDAGGIVAKLPLHMRMAINGLIKAGERNSDPALYADLIFDQVTGDDLTGLRQILTAPDWKAKLFGDETKVAHVGPWLDQLRVLIMEDTNATSDAASEQPVGGETIPNPG